MSDDKGGRPPGKRTSAPVVNINAARKALKDVKQRALEGSPEDQRCLLGVFYAALPRINPYTGDFIVYQPAPPGRTSLLDPPPHTPATVHDLRGPDDAA